MIIRGLHYLGFEGVLGTLENVASLMALLDESLTSGNREGFVNAKAAKGLKIIFDEIQHALDAVICEGKDGGYLASEVPSSVYLDILDNLHDLGAVVAFMSDVLTVLPPHHSLGQKAIDGLNSLLVRGSETVETAYRMIEEQAGNGLAVTGKAACA